MRLITIGCVLGLSIGCGGSTAPPPESPAQSASRIFSVGQELEKANQKKRAINAYQQLVRLFPESAEAKAASLRISEIQRESIRNAASRPKSR
jgi:predicted TPR repeat methyltransferase